MCSSKSQNIFRVAVLSVVKHSYVPLGVTAHPRFEPVVVADDADQPSWVHQRNEQFASELGVPYIRNVEEALTNYDVQVAAVSSQPERHCDLSVRAANAGLHVVQDKPMSTKVSECDRVIEAVERNGVKFMMWNRNCLPSILKARELIDSGSIGKPFAIHLDFYFAKDAGPPKKPINDDVKPINWQEHQIAAHADGSDGGVGVEPMGELKIEGIYPLAYIRMLTGAEVQSVFARTTSHFHQAHADNDVDDLATVTLEMDGGMIGSLCIGRIGRSSHIDSGEIKLHVIGSHGALVITEARPEVGIYYRGQPQSERRNITVSSDADFLLMENFSNAIDNNGNTILDAKSGRAIAATVEAAIDSGRTGKPVSLS